MKVTNNSSNQTQNLSTTKVLEQKLKNIFANDKSLHESKDFVTIQNLLKDLFSKVNKEELSNTKILDLLQKLPIFKAFKGVSQEVAKLNNLLENSEHISKESRHNIQNLSLDIKKLDSSILQSHISKNGIFLERYIKDFVHNESKNDNITDNLKSNLLQLIQTQDEAVRNQANKIISQIEYFGLFSYLNDSNKLPLNFDWNELKDGDIEFFKSSNNLHTCTIELNLEHYKKVKINLSYDDKNQLNIAFMCEDKHFKDRIEDNIVKIQHDLKNQNFNLQSIGVYMLDIIESVEKKFNFEIENPYEIDIRV